MRHSAWIHMRRFWRVHRWRLAIGLAALPFLTAMALSAVGSTHPRPRPPSRAQVCIAAERATRDIKRRFPNTSPQQLAAMKQKACSHQFTYVATPRQERIATTPGCHLDRPALPSKPLRRRTVAEPPNRIPYFAARSGSLPPSGSPVVGGVRMPAGSRCGTVWSTDAGVEDALGLAARLATAFPDTGLWPVLWTSPDGEPDSYLYAYGHGGPERADSLDAGTIMRHAWNGSGYGHKHPFPGLATAGSEAERLGVDPFGEITAHSLADAPPGGWIVMLVPVNRPADVLSVLRPAVTEYFRDHELTALFRSWEERFGAVVVALSPGGVEMAVGAPPRDDEQARLLAIEHDLTVPDEYGDSEFVELQRQLRTNRVIQEETSAHYWSFGWPD